VFSFSWVLRAFLKYPDSYKTLVDSSVFCAFMKVFFHAKPNLENCRFCQKKFLMRKILPAKGSVPKVISRNNLLFSIRKIEFPTAIYLFKVLILLSATVKYIH